MSADWRTDAEEALARGRRFDRRIPAVLLRSPISRAGFWWGTAVGWLWGGLWSTGPVERRAGLWVFRGMPRWTFRRGGVCVGGCFLTGDARPSDAVLRHEAVHKAQWLRYGILMPVLYLFAGRDPLRNRFEIEAGLEDGNYVRRSS
ncbi:MULTISPECIES: Fe-S oxidoreductase [unclassified Microbacterium]|uniref:Fe-S oxidoreductase n=1 Tax=unclassified Microbacterium TaxID=2609290 RepID=UPI000EA9C1BE|nr:MULTISPECIES: Fe-S oxidoreductase [unclassified Microbacterium]MBT2485476.1 Fe-S oxidoreductase [Microbacterium sp. ISL-108]RKN68271.1 Fe-S oxidoreductase [Microbacterium sp. CGR2]